MVDFIAILVFLLSLHSLSCFLSYYVLVREVHNFSISLSCTYSLKCNLQKALKLFFCCFCCSCTIRFSLLYPHTHTNTFKSFASSSFSNQLNSSSLKLQQLSSADDGKFSVETAAAGASSSLSLWGLKNVYFQFYY